MAHKLASFSKGFSTERKVAGHVVHGAGLAVLRLAAAGAVSKAFGAARVSKGNSTHLSRSAAFMKKHKK